MKEIVEQEICKKIERLVGYVPVGTVDLLHILVHPDVIHLTEKYVRDHQ